MTKRLVFSLILSSAIGVGQSRTSISGTWRVHTLIDGNDMVSECDFSQTGASVSGTCSSEQGTVDVVGQVKAPSVSLSYDSDYNGTASTITLTGTVAGQRMTGKVSVDPDEASGKFTAVLARRTN